MILPARNANNRYKMARELAGTKLAEKEKQAAEKKRKAQELFEKESERKRLCDQLNNLYNDISSLKKIKII